MTGAMKEGDTYIVSGWVKANASPNTLTGTNRPFNITVTLTAENERIYSILATAKFNTTVTGWQYVSVPVVMRPYGSSGWTPDRVKVTINYGYQTGTAYFDKLMLIKDHTSSYTYDSNGNITKMFIAMAKRYAITTMI